MNGRIQRDIISRINKIEVGDFTADDIELFLIHIRPYTENEDRLIRDICDFIAHPNIRNKGDTHGFLIEIFSKVVREKIKDGVIDHPLDPIFTQEQIIDGLISLLERWEFQFDKSLLYQHADNITLAILYFLQGVEFNFTIDDTSYWGQFSSLGNINKLAGLQFLFVTQIYGRKLEFIFSGIKTNFPLTRKALQALKAQA
jgi:hypothetical protein